MKFRIISVIINVITMLLLNFNIIQLVKQEIINCFLSIQKVQTHCLAKTQLIRHHHCLATTQQLRHHRRLATSGRHHGSQLSHRKRSGNGRKRHLKVHQLTKISKLIQVTFYLFNILKYLSFNENICVFRI